MERPIGSDGDRGQTGIDFFVGMGVFLLALMFVLAFVPSMFAPFFGMGVGDTLAADRSASYLTENALAEEPDAASVLDPDEVDAFFDECNTATDPGAHLADELGVGTTSVNVTIGDEWACGEEPTGADTVARRVVELDGDEHTLRVVIW